MFWCFFMLFLSIFRSPSQIIAMAGWQSLAVEYDPLCVGHINGTKGAVHDRGLIRALEVNLIFCCACFDSDVRRKTEKIVCWSHSEC